MLNILIFGAPGSGKGTQSELIKMNFDLAHISTGEALRQEIKYDTELGKAAKTYIDKGLLVPDEIIYDIIDETLERLKELKGVVFDGFPRTIAQAEALEKILAKRGDEVTMLLDLQVNDAELTRRLLYRGIISGRTDDNETTIQARLKVYHEQTAPLAEYYEKQGKRIVIQGDGPIDEIHSHIMDILYGRV